MSGVVRVLFVCSGNICRSPTAHGVFEALVRQAGLSDHIRIDSCGIGDWHEGEPPDHRTRKHAKQRGYDLSSLRARQVRSSELSDTEYILAMDRGHLESIRRLCPPTLHARVRLFLDFAPDQPLREVPDPYYGGAEGFEHVLDLVESASRGLLQHLKAELG